MTKNAQICHFFGLTQFGLLILTSLLCYNKCTASQGKRHFFHYILFSFRRLINFKESKYRTKKCIDSKAVHLYVSCSNIAFLGYLTE